MVNRKFKEILFKQNRRKYLKNAQNKKNGVIFMPTPAQKKLVSEYIDKLTPILQLNNPGLYLESICLKTFRKNYIKLNKGEMQRLIEALKSIHKRKQEKNNDIQSK